MEASDEAPKFSCGNDGSANAEQDTEGAHVHEKFPSGIETSELPSAPAEDQTYKCANGEFTRA